MCNCTSSSCCRCDKGPDVEWLGAYNLGEHLLCISCYYELADEWGCSD